MWKPDAEPALHAAQRRELAIERLASLSPGGARTRPLIVTAAAVVEVRAAALPCPHCGGLFRLLEHTRPVPELRRVDVECRNCGTPRALWFRIVEREARAS